MFQKLQCTCLCTTAYSFFFHFPSDLLSLKSRRSAPLPRTIITLVCDPHWVAGREMNSQAGLQGLEYYFVWTNTACSSLHSFTWSDWCWQFPQTELCNSKAWSMALISQNLSSIRPLSNLFLPTTKLSDVPTAHTHTAAANPRFYTNTSAASASVYSLQVSNIHRVKSQFQPVKPEVLRWL